MSIIDSLRKRYGLAYENCRYIFTNDLLGMKNINIQTTSINTFNILENLNNIYSVIMNIFCFPTIDKTITFISDFSKNYDSFLDSLVAKNLFFYNKHLINNLRVIFKLRMINQNSFENQSETMNMNNVNNLIGLQQSNGFSSLDSSNIKYAFFSMSKDGVLLNEEAGNKLENILFSFNYNSIKDCLIEMVPKQLVLPKQMFSTNPNKCCLKMKIDTKDVFDNILYICSFKDSNYQCHLESKFLQEMLMNKCAFNLSLNIGYAFENNINMSSYIMGIIASLFI